MKTPKPTQTESIHIKLVKAAEIPSTYRTAKELYNEGVREQDFHSFAVKFLQTVPAPITERIRLYIRDLERDCHYDEWDRLISAGY